MTTPQDGLGWLEFTRSGGVAGTVLSTRVEPGDPEAGRFAGLLSGLMSELGMTDLTGLQQDEPTGVADRFRYDLRGEVAGRPFVLSCGDASVPAELRPLLTGLTERARRPAPDGR